MFNFFEKQKMKNVVLAITSSYNELKEDPNRFKDEELKDFVKLNNIISAMIAGSYVFTRNSNMKFPEYLDILYQSVVDIVRREGGIKLEYVVFTAAGLVGDFPKHAKEVATYFGVVARKENLSSDIFDFVPTTLSDLEENYLKWRATFLGYL